MNEKEPEKEEEQPDDAFGPEPEVEAEEGQPGTTEDEPPKDE